MDSNHSESNHSESTPIDEYEEIYKSSLYIAYRYISPFLYTFGIVGNILNLIVLSARGIKNSLKSNEKMANLGLIALAFSDMMFCITAFPTCFISHDNVYQTKGFLIFYVCYLTAIANSFMLSSTWLTVAMSIERYIAICHPLAARYILSRKKTSITIISIYIVSILFNLPNYFLYEIVPFNITSIDQTFITFNNNNNNNINNNNNNNNNTNTLSGFDSILINSTAIPRQLYQVETVFEVQLTEIAPSIERVYNIIWAMFGNILPLIALIFFNVALLLQIHKSYAFQKTMYRSTSNVVSNSTTTSLSSEQRVTTTLICIVVMFFVLVAPAELTKFITSELESEPSFVRIIEVVTNLMQSLNFAVNFVLYCIVNPTFRKTLKGLIYRSKGKKSFASSSDQSATKLTTML